MDAVIPRVAVTFDGQFLPGDQVFVSIGGQTCGKTVFPNEDAALIARHFAYFINATYVGVWAAVEDNVLTITARSPAPPIPSRFRPGRRAAAGFDRNCDLRRQPPGRAIGALGGGPCADAGAQPGRARMAPGLLRSSAGCGSREITVAASMELVNPPADFGARYRRRQVVETSVGFGSFDFDALRVLEPHAPVPEGALQGSGRHHARRAALVPNLQFGEFCWWYFTNTARTTPAEAWATTTTRRKPLPRRRSGVPCMCSLPPRMTRSVNGGADAAFLRNRLRDHVAALVAHMRAHHPAAKLEVLFPFDVNYPMPAGVHQIGGRLEPVREPSRRMGSTRVPAAWIA